MNKILFALLATILVSCRSEQPKYIAITETTTVKVPVDYFEVRIQINVHNEDQVKANTTTKSLIHKLFEIFEKHSIPDSDFVTQSSQTAESYLPSSSNTSMYEQRKVISYVGILVLRDTRIYDALFQDIVALGNTNIGVYEFGSYQIDRYKELAFKQAFDKAKGRAAMILAGTNQKLGRLYKVLQDGRDRFADFDNIDGLYDVSGSQDRTSKYSDLGPPPPSPSTFKKKYFNQTATMTVIFEIE